MPRSTAVDVKRWKKGRRIVVIDNRDGAAPFYGKKGTVQGFKNGLVIVSLDFGGPTRAFRAHQLRLTS